jgi:hypothetical protein
VQEQQRIGICQTEVRNFATVAFSPFYLGYLIARHHFKALVL